MLAAQCLAENTACVTKDKLSEISALKSSGEGEHFLIEE
jgi:hypothetical protein